MLMPPNGIGVGPGISSVLSGPPVSGLRSPIYGLRVFGLSDALICRDRKVHSKLVD